MDNTDSNADLENCSVSLTNGNGIEGVSSMQPDVISMKNPSGHVGEACQVPAASKNVADGSKDDMLVGEDGELDYDEDEDQGEEEKTEKGLASAELEEGELEEEGEEGEILSGEENKVCVELCAGFLKARLGWSHISEIHHLNL